MSMTYQQMREQQIQRQMYPQAPAKEVKREEVKYLTLEEAWKEPGISKSEVMKRMVAYDIEVAMLRPPTVTVPITPEHIAHSWYWRTLLRERKTEFPPEYLEAHAEYLEQQAIAYEEREAYKKWFKEAEKFRVSPWRYEQALLTAPPPETAIFPELGYPRIVPYVPGKEPTSIQLRPPTEEELKPIGQRIREWAKAEEKKLPIGLIEPTTGKPPSWAGVYSLAQYVGSVEALWRGDVATIYQPFRLAEEEKEYPGTVRGAILGEVTQFYLFGKIWAKTVTPVWREVVVPSRLYHAIRYSRPVMALESKVRGTYAKYIGQRFWGYKPPAALQKYEKILRPLTLPPIGRGYEGFYYVSIHYPSILYPSKIYYPIIPQWRTITAPKGLSLQQILTKYVKFGEASEKYEREVLLRTVKFGDQEIPELTAKIYKPSFIEWSEEFRLFVGLPKKTILEEVPKLVHTPFAFHFAQPIKGMPISKLYRETGPTLKLIGIKEEKLATWINQLERQYGRYRTPWVVHFPEITQKRLSMYFVLPPKAVGFPVVQIPQWIKEHERKYGKKTTAWGEPKPVEVQFLEKEVEPFKLKPRRIPLFPPEELLVSTPIFKRMEKRIEKTVSVSVPSLVKHKGPQYPFLKMREWGKPKVAPYPSVTFKERRKEKERREVTLRLKVKGISEEELKEWNKQSERATQLPSQVERQFVGQIQGLELKQVQMLKFDFPPPQKLGITPKIPPLPPPPKWPRQEKAKRRRKRIKGLRGEWFKRRHPIPTPREVARPFGFGVGKTERRGRRKRLPKLF